MLCRIGANGVQLRLGPHVEKRVRVRIARASAQKQEAGGNQEEAGKQSLRGVLAHRKIPKVGADINLGQPGLPYLPTASWRLPTADYFNDPLNVPLQVRDSSFSVVTNAHGASVPVNAPSAAV